MHGPPLAHPSCSSPTQQSGTLTVGTPDANGFVANSSGSVRFDVMLGNPNTPADEADVGIAVDITDVRCAGTNTACPSGQGSDYTGKPARDLDRADHRQVQRPRRRSRTGPSSTPRSRSRSAAR